MQLWLDIRNGFKLDPNLFDGERKASFVTPAQLLDEFIASNPGNARALEVRGVIRLMLRKRTEAEQDFNKALRLDSKLTSEINRLIKENDRP
jgi:predicted Zn-dependent protease